MTAVYKSFSAVLLLLWVLVPSASARGSTTTCNGISKEFYFVIKVEFDTTDSCSQTYVDDIETIVSSTIKDVASETSNMMKEDRYFVAKETEVVNNLCPNPVVSRVVEGSRRLGVPMMKGTLQRGLRSFHLQVDLLGAGKWKLCYPTETFQPPDDSGMFSMELQMKLSDLELQIATEKLEEDEIWRTFSDKEHEKTVEMEYRQAEIMSLIEKELIDMNEEEEELAVAHRNERLQLNYTHMGQVPDQLIKELDEKQQKEVEALKEQHKLKKIQHEDTTVALEEELSGEREQLEGERSELDKTQRNNEIIRDLLRAKLQAQIAQQNFLKDPEKQISKQTETANEDFFAIQARYEKNLKKTLADSLWGKYGTPTKGNDACFMEKPDVSLLMRRVVSERDADLDANKCEQAKDFQ